MKSYLTIYSILFVVLRITPASSHPNPNALVAISKGTRAVKLHQQNRPVLEVPANKKLYSPANR